jgi:RNA polymerase sigma-70 factor (ECF subfamily)
MTDYKTYSDSQLIELIEKGDHPAYTEIFNRYCDLVYNEAFRKLGDEDHAKDIVQEIFTNLWAKRETMINVSNLAGYLITCTKNTIFNFFEHQHVESRYITSLKDYVNTGNIAHTDYLLREKEWSKYIEDAINTLPKKMKAVFELRTQSHMSHKQIAETLSLSERTVNAQLLNAVKRLRSKLTLILFF